jgi:hypothetical protein
VNYGGAAGVVAANTAFTGSFTADFTRGAAATAREHKYEIPTVDYDDAVYSPLAGDASELVKVTRHGKGRLIPGGTFFRFSGKTLDSAAYAP